VSRPTRLLSREFFVCKRVLSVSWIVYLLRSIRGGKYVCLLVSFFMIEILYLSAKGPCLPVKVQNCCMLESRLTICSGIKLRLLEILCLLEIPHMLEIFRLLEILCLLEILYRLEIPSSTRDASSVRNSSSASNSLSARHSSNATDALSPKRDARTVEYSFYFLRDVFTRKDPEADPLIQVVAESGKLIRMTKTLFARIIRLVVRPV
jgi:hypothetical protein